MRRRSVAVLVLVTVVLGGCSAREAGRGTPEAGPAVAAWSGVDGAAVVAHLGVLERIARENGGNRAAGSPGYEASVRYLQGKLDAAGFRTQVQPVPGAPRGTTSLIADLPGGDEGSVLVTGAHLDSVAAGPGINDNGTGAAAVLEVALAAARDPDRPRRHLRFAWWGGEELGLLGSQEYVRALPADRRQAIAGYLNADMVGSPNAGYFVYDGDDSDRQGAGPGPAGSAGIERALVAAFDRLGVRAAGTDFSGRSDYGPFVAAGIPAGGTFTGAEGVKTAAEAALWGGTAGKPYDPCYHQACDTAANVDATALDRNADALAIAVRILATAP